MQRLVFLISKFQRSLQTIKLLLVDIMQEMVVVLEEMRVYSRTKKFKLVAILTTKQSHVGIGPILELVHMHSLVSLSILG